MDFTSLPDNIFRQIFHYLSLFDQIRAGAVSVAFRRMYEIVISETKSFDFTDDYTLLNISPHCFSHLMNLCHGRLEEMQFGFHRKDRCLSNVFVKYSYPKLKKLSSPCNCDMAVLLRNNAGNLESLSISNKIRFPNGVVMKRMETLDCWCDKYDLNTFSGRMPNLKHVKLKADGLSKETLDRFLGTVPQLESLSIFLSPNYTAAATLDLLEGNGMTAFWQLNLRRLEVDFCGCDYLYSSFQVNIGDNALMEVAKCFPRLRVLSLSFVESGNSGVAALSSLQDLQELKLESQIDIDAGLCELSKCKRLEKLQVGSREKGRRCVLLVHTVMTLLRSCPRLSFIGFSDFADIRKTKDAASFVTSLADLEQRTITLQFHCSGSRTKGIWGSLQVKRAQMKLEAAGMLVQFLLPSE